MELRRLEQLPCHSEQCSLCVACSVRSSNSVADAADAPLKWQRRVSANPGEILLLEHVYTSTEDQFLLTNSNIACKDSSIFSQQTRTTVLTVCRCLEFIICERVGSATFISAPADVADYNFWLSGISEFSTAAALLRRLHLTLADRLAWSKYRWQFCRFFCSYICELLWTYDVRGTRCECYRYAYTGTRFPFISVFSEIVLNCFLVYKNSLSFCLCSERSRRVSTYEYTHWDFIIDVDHINSLCRRPWRHR